jgi:hypothetical protein
MLFKYMKSKYAESFFTAGTLRIGTLHEYRNVEKYGPIVGDRGEGKKTIRTTLKPDDVWTEESMPDHMRSVIKLVGGARLHSSMGDFIVNENSQDYYLFCTTSVFSKSVMKEFEADVCIAIVNVQGFFDALAATMKDRGTLLAVAKCFYGTRYVRHETDHGVPAPLIKPKRYERQQEVRAIWQPHAKSIESFNIDCKEAAVHCKIHYA